jgi:hypothetical protein
MLCEFVEFQCRPRTTPSQPKLAGGKLHPPAMKKCMQVDAFHIDGRCCKVARRGEHLLHAKRRYFGWSARIMQQTVHDRIVYVLEFLQLLLGERPRAVTLLQCPRPWFCGFSFDKRICVSGHENPSWVQHCRTCGKDRSLMVAPALNKGTPLLSTRDEAEHLTSPATPKPLIPWPCLLWASASRFSLSLLLRFSQVWCSRDTQVRDHH